MKTGKTNGLKRIVEIAGIPAAAFLIMVLLCGIQGVKLFEMEGNWILFFRAAASVMLTTFALSLIHI